MVGGKTPPKEERHGPGLFELCNPHFLPSDLLSQAIRDKLGPGADNNSQVRSVLLELFKNNLSPKPQRTHRDNNRGATLKRLQKTSLKRSESDDKVKDSKCLKSYTSSNITSSPTTKQHTTWSSGGGNKTKSDISHSPNGSPGFKRAKINWP